MPPKPKEIHPNACGFCGSEEENEEAYGKMLRKCGITIHYFCMLFSSGLWQRGKRDQDGILGFMPVDIRREQKRGQRLTCQYCKKKGATIGCCVSACRKTFHFRCGMEAGGLCQFYQEFPSYCPDHRPRQGTPASSSDRLAFYGTAKSTCSICMLAVEARSSNDTLRSPCCRNAWFHRSCIQKYAVTAGAYFFKCPLCNNKDLFEAEMLEFGIYIPEQDAAWEQEPNAFHDLLERYSRCDAEKCLCPQGPDHSGTAGSRWELILCNWCGSSGTHKACEAFTKISKESVCKECAQISTVVQKDRKKKKQSSSANSPPTSLNEEELRLQLEQRCSSSLRVLRAAKRHHSTSPTSNDQQQPSTSRGRKAQLESARVTSPTILKDHRLTASIPVVRIERAESEVDVNVVDLEDDKMEAEMCHEEKSSGDAAAARLHSFPDFRAEQTKPKKRAGRPPKKRRKSWGVKGVIDKGSHKVVLVSILNDNKPDYSSDCSGLSTTSALKTDLQLNSQSQDRETNTSDIAKACLNEEKGKVLDIENERVDHQDSSRLESSQAACDLDASRVRFCQRPLRARQLFLGSAKQCSSDDNNNFSEDSSSGEVKFPSPAPGPSKTSPRLTRSSLSRLQSLRQLKRGSDSSSSSEERDSESSKSRLTTRRWKMTRRKSSRILSFKKKAETKGRKYCARSSDSSTSSDSMATKVRYHGRHTAPSTFVHSPPGCDDDNAAWFDKSKSSSGLSTDAQGPGSQAVAVKTCTDEESPQSPAIIEILNIKADPATECIFKSTSPFVKTEVDTQPVEIESTEDERDIGLAPQTRNGTEKQLLQTPLEQTSELSSYPGSSRNSGVSSGFSGDQTRIDLTQSSPPVPASYAQFQIPKPQTSVATWVPPPHSVPPRLVLSASSEHHQVTAPDNVVQPHCTTPATSNRYHHQLFGYAQPSAFSVPVCQAHPVPVVPNLTGCVPQAEHMPATVARYIPAGKPQQIVQIQRLPVIQAVHVTGSQAEQLHASPSQARLFYTPVTQTQHLSTNQAQYMPVTQSHSVTSGTNVLLSHVQHQHVPTSKAHIPITEAHPVPITQAQHAGQTQVQDVTLMQAQHVTRSQAQLLAISQAQHASQAQIQGVPPVQAQQVMISQVQPVAKTQVQHASQNQVQVVPPMQTRPVAVNQAQHLSQAQVQGAPLMQTQHVPVTQAQCVTMSQTQHLALSQAQHLSQAQVQGVPLMQTHNVPVTQAQHVTISQVQGVSQAQIQGVPPIQAQCIPVTQAQHVTVSQVQHAALCQAQHLSQVQVQGVPPMQAQHVSQAQVQLQGVPLSQAPNQPIIQAQHATQAQIQGVPVTQVQMMVSQSQVQNMSHRPLSRDQNVALATSATMGGQYQLVPGTQPTQVINQVPRMPTSAILSILTRPVQYHIMPRSQAVSQLVGHSELRPSVRETLQIRSTSHESTNRSVGAYPEVIVTGSAQSASDVITGSQHWVTQSGCSEVAADSWQAPHAAAAGSACGSKSNDASPQDDCQMVDVYAGPKDPSSQVTSHQPADVDVPVSAHKAGASVVTEYDTVTSISSQVEERSITPTLVPGSAISLLPMLEKSCAGIPEHNLNIVAEFQSQSHATSSVPGNSLHLDVHHRRKELNRSSLLAFLQSVSTHTGATVSRQQTSSPLAGVNQQHREHDGPPSNESEISSAKETFTSAVALPDKSIHQKRRQNKPLTTTSGQPVKRQAGNSYSSITELQSVSQPEMDNSLPLSRGKIWSSPNPVPTPVRSGTMLALLSDSEGSDVELIDMERKSALAWRVDDNTGMNYSKNVAGQTDLGPMQHASPSSLVSQTALPSTPSVPPYTPSVHSAITSTFSNSMTPSTPSAHAFTPSEPTAVRPIRPWGGRPPCPVHGYRHVVRHPVTSSPAQRNADGSLTIDLTVEAPSKDFAEELSSDSDEVIG